jgi:bifunctional lysine-specific demethylase and histidyl-hydroxylase MINA
MPSWLDLASLLTPLSLEAFLAEYWQQQPHVSQHGDRARFAHLVSVHDVDFLVSSLSAASDWLQLVRETESVREARVQSDGGFVDLSKVREAYDEGYTLVLKRLHRRWLPIAQLCRTIEADITMQGVLLSAPVGANLYFTPRSAQGFPLHYDDHDVLVLQIEGRKRWRLFETCVPFPLDRPSAPVGEDECGRLQREVVVEPGDVVYIPRGFCHDASTTSDPSLHLTVGIYPYVWLDLAVELMKGQERFRQALPIVPVDRVPDMFVEEFRTRVNDLLRLESLAGTLAALRQSYWKKLPPLPDAGFRQLDGLGEVTLDSVVGRRDGVLARVISDAGCTTLMLPGSVFHGPLVLEPVLRFMLGREAFTVRDLPDVISDAGKLEFTRAMIKEGLLRAH